MNKGTVKWFNKEKGLDLLQMKAMEKMYSYIFLESLQKVLKH